MCTGPTFCCPSEFVWMLQMREKSLPLLRVQTPLPWSFCPITLLIKIVTNKTLPWSFCPITLLIKIVTNKTQSQELYITFLALNYGKSNFITKYWDTQNTTGEHNTLTDWRMGKYNHTFYLCWTPHIYRTTEELLVHMTDTVFSLL